MKNRWALGILSLTVFCSGEAAEKSVLTVYPATFPVYEQITNGLKSCLADKTASIVSEGLSGNESDMETRLASLPSPNVILAIGSTPLSIAKRVFKNRPIVFCMVLYPQKNGYVGGVAANLKPEDQIAFIAESFPELKKIGIIYNPASSNMDEVNGYESAGARTGITVIKQAVPSMADVLGAISRLTRDVDAILMINDVSLFPPQYIQQIIMASLQENVPIIASSLYYIKAGAFAGMYADPEDNGCQAAKLVDKALRENIQPSEVLYPTKLKSAVNLITAERLKIKIDNAVLQKAEKVIR